MWKYVRYERGSWQERTRLRYKNYATTYQQRGIYPYQCVLAITVMSFFKILYFSPSHFLCNTRRLTMIITFESFETPESIMSILWSRTLSISIFNKAKLPEYCTWWWVHSWDGGLSGARHHDSSSSRLFDIDMKAECPVCHPLWDYCFTFVSYLCNCFSRLNRIVNLWTGRKFDWAEVKQKFMTNHRQIFFWKAPICVDRSSTLHL